MTITKIIQYICFRNSIFAITSIKLFEAIRFESVFGNLGNFQWTRDNK